MKQHPFWGSLSPLGGLTGAAILIMASARLAWSITITGALIWVYGLSAFVFTLILNLVPKEKFHAGGLSLIFTCLASFFGSLYLLFIWFLSPFAAFEVFLVLLLVPLFCASSGVFQRIVSVPENTQIDILEHVSDAVSQAAALAGLLIAFSIIREPLSYCSLSLPGTFQGMITIVYFRAGSFFPIGIFSASAGALLLLGYFICLYQYGKGFFHE